MNKLAEFQAKIYAHAQLRPTLDDAEPPTPRARVSNALLAWDQEMTWLNHERRKYHIYAVAINDPPPHTPDIRRQSLMSSGVALSPVDSDGTTSTLIAPPARLPPGPSALSQSVISADSPQVTPEDTATATGTAAAAGVGDVLA